MEVIKQQMAKDDPPPVAPHAPLHGISQPANLLATPISNNSMNLSKGPRPTSGILRHSNLAASS